MSIADLIYPYLIDEGYMVFPDIMDELDYQKNYVDKKLLGGKRNCDKLERIKLEMGTGNGGNKYDMKELYGRTDLQQFYYMDILSFYPKIFKGLNELFRFDLTGLNGSKKGVITHWANERIHSTRFREYFLDKVEVVSVE